MVNIEHHLHTSRNAARRRFVVDVVIALLFLLAIGAVVLAHLTVQKNEDIVRQHDEQLIEEEQRRADTAERLRIAAQGELDRTKSDDVVRGNTQAMKSLSADTPPLSEEVLSPTLSPASTSEGIASNTVATLQGFPHFEDVTVTRIENQRLGFLMELPAGWSLAYERNSELAYANSEYYFGVTDKEITQKDGAMWLHVVRPCNSTQGTTTVFQFVQHAVNMGANVREATACVAPFLVTVGYRDDAPDRLGRELFLLSVARTLYPIVSPNAPYLPMR